jgi:hypothetical protein
MADIAYNLSMVKQRLEILYQIVEELERQGGGGGQGGTDDYTELTNKPRINDITLVGNKSLTDLGIASAAALNDKADKSTTYTKTQVDTALTAKADKSTTYTKTETQSYVQGEITGAINDLDHTSVGGSTKVITTISQANGIINATAADTDTIPTANSNRLVRSQGIKTYVDNAKTAANSYTDTQVATKASINDIYGPGIIIPDGADLNDDAYKVPGVYYRKSASTSSYIENTPITSNFFKIIVEWVYPDNRLKQTFISLARDCTYYVRVYDSGGWQAWNRFRSFDQVIDGVYGIGTTIESGTDLNNLTTAGLYTCPSITVANTLANTPVSGSAFRLEVKYINNSTRIRQECYILSDISTYYARTYTSTGWKPWYMFTGTQVVPPESQQNLTSLQSANLTVEPNGEVDA